jgi:hypothetical protein
MNLLTMQQEVPPEHHWQHVLLQLQPTERQVLQLAAGHVLFKRLCTADKKAQRALADTVSAANSCSLLVLAALSSAANTRSASNGDGNSSCSDAAHASGEQGGAAAQSVPPAEQEPAAAASEEVEPAAGASGAQEPAAASSGLEDAAAASSGKQGVAVAAGEEMEAATAESDAAPTHTPGTQSADPVSSMESLLRRLTHTSGLMHMLMLNTLTREQIARLVVVSSPFAPRPAPIMEAAHHLVQQGRDWQQSMWAKGEELQLFGSWLVAAPRPGTQEHSDARTQLLRRQVQEWWSMAPGRLEEHGCAIS